MQEAVKGYAGEAEEFWVQEQGAMAREAAAAESDDVVLEVDDGEVLLSPPPQAKGRRVQNGEADVAQQREELVKSADVAVQDMSPPPLKKKGGMFSCCFGG